MRIRAIVFDLDNTLMDFIEMKRQGCRAAAKELIESGLGIGNKDAENLLMQTHLDIGDDGEEVFEEFLRRVGKKAEPGLVKKSFEAYNRAKTPYIRPYPGVLEMLAFLKGKGMKLAIITDAEEPQAMERIRGIGVKDYFDAIVTSSDTSVMKPDKKPFFEALKRLGAKAEETLMVGDSIRRDIFGAKKAGMLSAYAKYGEDWEIKWPPHDAKPDYVLNDICELMQIVK